MEVAAWSPPQWSFTCFPLPTPDAEVVTMAFVVRALHDLADQVTEADTTPLGAALHVAHILKTMQGADGAWPDAFNVRTGKPVGDGRTFGPAELFRRLNAMLNSTEFEVAYEFAVRNGYGDG